MAVNETEITSYLTNTFAGIHVVEAWGDTFFFYNPERDAPDEVYFATLKSNDDASDSFSNLNRDGIFRLSIGVSKATYRALLGAPPSRHGNGGDVEPSAADNFSTLDKLLPHPVYGRMHWICVLNPSEETFEVVKPLLAEAYEMATGKYAKRARGK